MATYPPKGLDDWYNALRTYFLDSFSEFNTEIQSIRTDAEDAAISAQQSSSVAVAARNTAEIYSDLAESRFNAIPDGVADELSVQVPPLLSPYVDAAETARDAAEGFKDQARDISNIETPDGVVKALIDDPGSQARGSLNAAQAEALVEPGVVRDAFSAAVALAVGPAVQSKYAAPERDARLVTRFQSGHGWTFIPNGGAVADDASMPTPFGWGAVKMVNAASGSTAEMEKINLSVPLDATSSLLIWLKTTSQGTLIPGTNTIVDVFAGDNTFTNYYLWSTALKVAHSGEWVCYELRPSRAAVTGTPAAVLTKIKIRATAGGGGGVTSYVAAVSTRPAQTAYPNGVVSFTFDDSPVSMFTEALPKLNQYGYPGVAHIICDLVDSGADSVTTAHLDEMQGDGWEIGAHAYTLANHDLRYTNLSPEALETELREMKLWLIARGYRGETWAAPGGQINDAVWRAARKYYNAHRVAGSSSLNGFGGELGLPPPYLPNIPCRSFATGSAPVATLQTEITRAKTTKSWVILNLHGIVPGASTGPSIGRADFAALVDHCNAQGVAVQTFDQVREATAY